MVDYVEEPMKYQALRPHSSLWVGGGGGLDGVLVRGGWVMGWSGWWWGEWCAGEGGVGGIGEGGWCGG